MKKNIYIIFLLQAFIFNLTNVITPGYLNSLHLPKYMFGYFSAVWSLGMLISSPLWGNIAKKYGRKKLVILGIVIYGSSQLGFYYFENIYILAILRLVSGIGVGAIVTLMLSYLIMNTDPKQRPKVLSYRMAFLTIGVTLSYTIGGVIGEYLTRELFLYQSILSIIFIVLIVLFMREEKVKSCIYPKQFNMFNSIKHIKDMDKSIIVFLFSITLTTMTFVNIDKFIDLYIIDEGYGEGVLGSIKMVFGIVLIMTNFVVIPNLKKYIGNIYVLQTITVMMAIIIMVTFIEGNIILPLFTIFLGFIVLKGIYTTSEQVYLSKVVTKEQINVFIGIRQSFTCLGMILGPIIGGHIYAFSPQHLFHFNVICLLISSVLISFMRPLISSKKSLAYNK